MTPPHDWIEPVRPSCVWPATPVPTVACADLRRLLDQQDTAAMSDDPRGSLTLAQKIAGLLERHGILIDYRPAEQLPAQGRVLLDDTPAGEALRSVDDDLFAVRLRLVSLLGLLAETEQGTQCRHAGDLTDQARHTIVALLSARAETHLRKAGIL